MNTLTVVTFEINFHVSFNCSQSKQNFFWENQCINSSFVSLWNINFKLSSVYTLGIRMDVLGYCIIVTYKKTQAQEIVGCEIIIVNGCQTKGAIMAP